jgi:outer membrane protein TolC
MKKIIILVILLINSMLFAENLTLEKAKEIALKNNNELISEELSRKAAHSEAVKSTFNLIPSASLTGSYTKFDEAKNVSISPNSTADNSKSYRISVTQPIFNGGKNWLNYKIKKDQASIADANYYSKYLEVMTQTEAKYLDVLMNYDLMESAEKMLLASNQHLNIAKMKYELGNLSKTDYLKIQSETASKEVGLIQKRNLYEISRIELANFLQISNDFFLEKVLIDEYETRISSIQKLDLDKINELVDNIISIGIEKNPSLRASSLNKSIYKKNIHLTYGEFLPAINFSYSKSWGKYDYEDDFNENSGNISLNASLPIFPVADNILGLSQAKIDMKKSKYSYNSTEDNIRLALRSNILNLVSKAKSIYSAKIALDYAEETFKNTEAYFKNNTVTTTDLLDAENLLSSSKNQYITNYYEFLQSKSSLLQQMGVDDENVLWILISQ